MIENKHCNRPFPCYIIDTEGLGAFDEEVNHDIKIFLIAVVASSLLIYNSVGTIDENSINDLSLVVNISKNIKLNHNSNEPEDLSHLFPSFVWLLRDFMLRLEDSEGNVITAKQYLENGLANAPGETDGILAKNKVRETIRRYFKERDCVTMIRPVDEEAKIQSLNQLDQSELKPEFLQEATTFLDKIKKKLKPKTMLDKHMTGGMLGELLVSICNSLNEGSVPGLESAWDYVIKEESNKVAAKFQRNFKSFLEGIVKFGKGEIEEINKRKDILIYEGEEEIEKKELGGKNKIKELIEGELDLFLKIKQTDFVKLLKELLEKHAKGLLKLLETDKYSKNYFLFFTDLEKLRDTVDLQVPEFENKKAIINDEMIRLIKRFIEFSFVKQKFSNEKEMLVLKKDLEFEKSKCSDLTKEVEKLQFELDRAQKEIIAKELLAK